jgi:hypothetical protein
MSVTYTTAVAVSANGARGVSGTAVDIGTNDLTISNGIPGGSSNLALGISFNGANLKQIELVSDQPLDLYINDVSGGSPFKHIAMVANNPFFWSLSGGYFSNPLNTSVTQIYATCSVSARLTGKVLT